MRANPEQVDMFDAKAARARRDEGMARASAHAEDVRKGWNDAAFAILKDYGPDHRIFLIEHVRLYAEQVWKLPPPPDSRAWGAVATRAAGAGVIRARGYVPSASVSGHRHPVTQWEWVG